jgi:glutamate-ammonia-ligase adenylyltransferase
MLADLRALIPVETPAEECDSLLRTYKARQFLRLGSRDLLGLASLEEVTAELSDLAAAALQIAYEFCSYQLQQDYGKPLEEDGRPAEFCVLGMGKLGGRELNFSSDIDLIYCYSSVNGQTCGTGSRGERIELRRYFIKLAEMITRALNQPTAEGFVFRVDTRLRPDGNNGDLAISLNAAEAYYESWGQSWERAAMIKARPVAGNIRLGNELLERLEPFVYRRFLDFSMIEDIMLMKRKIDASLNHDQEAELNLKLGRGGIREIEFFIQAQQLVNGGKNRQLRERNSLKALTLLAEQQVVALADTQVLQEAYRFLRQVEHRIQIVHERQTHSLPTQKQELRALARRCGFSDQQSFESQLEAHREQVRRIYCDLFHSNEPVEEVPREVRLLLDPETDSDLAKDILEEQGFNHPDIAYQSLKILQGHQVRRLTARGRRYLEQLAPHLLAELLHSPNPDQALKNLEAFLNRLRSRTIFYALLAENLEIVKLLISLFGSSQMLSRIFIQRPELLDTMVSRAYAVCIKPRQRLAEDLNTQMQAAHSYEEQLDILRRFRNEEFLRIALNDLHGELRQGEITRQLSWLAEVCLNSAIMIARHELIPRFGLPYLATDPECEVAFGVVAMGKLGGFELNYHSDLDIIFLYQGAGTTRPVAGTEPERFRELNAQEYFARLAQRIISVLTLVTSEGIVYKIDTQLRPSGNQGPLVTGLDVFERYHRESAQPWERQSMTRARMICGPEKFLNMGQALIETLTYEPELPENLAAEICRLRQRMEKEIARENDERINIKTGRGGMVDVEFICQYLQLVHGRQLTELRTQNTLEVLKKLHELKRLGDADSKVLIQGYKALRRLENKLRLLYDQSMNELNIGGTGLRHIARSLGYTKDLRQPEEHLLADYHRITEDIRQVFDAILGCEKSSLAMKADPA